MTIADDMHYIDCHRDDPHDSWPIEYIGAHLMIVQRHPHGGSYFKPLITNPHVTIAPKSESTHIIPRGRLFYPSLIKPIVDDDMPRRYSYIQIFSRALRKTIIDPSPPKDWKL